MELPTRSWLAMYRAREKVFGDMPEPQWRILLDLATNGPVPIKYAQIASGVPDTTALRHIGLLTKAGLAARAPHDSDQRSSLLWLTTEGADALEAVALFLEHGSAA